MFVRENYTNYNYYVIVMVTDEKKGTNKENLALNCEEHGKLFTHSYNFV